MSIDKTGGEGFNQSSMTDSSRVGKERHRRDADQYSQSGSDKPKGDGVRSRLSLKKSATSDSKSTGQAENKAPTDRSKNDSADMAFDQMMVLLQQALHEVPSSLTVEKRRKRGPS